MQEAHCLACNAEMSMSADVLRETSRFDVPMTFFVLRTRSPRLAWTGVPCGVAVLVFVAYALPFFGFLASLALPCITHAARRYLWPEASGTQSIIWSLMAWAGLWLPALLGIFALVTAGSEMVGGLTVSTMWLVMPLCAPDNLNALLLPALAAAVTCLAGLLGAAATRRGWTWVAAAWLAPWMHYLISAQIPHEFFC
jgi:hypothetical protein